MWIRSKKDDARQTVRELEKLTLRFNWRRFEVDKCHFCEVNTELVPNSLVMSIWKYWNIPGRSAIRTLYLIVPQFPVTCIEEMCTWMYNKSLALVKWQRLGHLTMALLVMKVRDDLICTQFLCKCWVLTLVLCTKKYIRNN